MPFGSTLRSPHAATVLPLRSNSITGGAAMPLTSSGVSRLPRVTIKTWSRESTQVPATSPGIHVRARPVTASGVLGNGLGQSATSSYFGARELRKSAWLWPAHNVKPAAQAEIAAPAQRNGSARMSIAPFRVRGSGPGASRERCAPHTGLGRSERRLVGVDGSGRWQSEPHCRTDACIEVCLAPDVAERQHSLCTRNANVDTVTSAINRSILRRRLEATGLLRCRHEFDDFQKATTGCQKLTIALVLLHHVAHEEVDPSLPCLVGIAAQVDRLVEYAVAVSKLAHLDVDVQDQIAHLLHPADQDSIRTGFARDLHLATVAAQEVLRLVRRFDQRLHRRAIHHCVKSLARERLAQPERDHRQARRRFGKRNLRRLFIDQLEIEHQQFLERCRLG